MEIIEAIKISIVWMSNHASYLSIFTFLFVLFGFLGIRSVNDFKKKFRISNAGAFDLSFSDRSIDFHFSFSIENRSNTNIFLKSPCLNIESPTYLNKIKGEPTYVIVGLREIDGGWNLPAKSGLRDVVVKCVNVSSVRGDVAPSSFDEFLIWLQECFDDHGNLPLKVFVEFKSGKKLYKTKTLKISIKQAILNRINKERSEIKEDNPNKSVIESKDNIINKLEEFLRKNFS